MEKDNYISVVIPTRDRPECIDMCLESLTRQTLEDFEIIVSDNSYIENCKGIVDKYCDKRIKYYRTDGTLPLNDSFEFAVKKATGKWILVLGDKNLLYQNALNKIQSILERDDMDVLNFPIDFFEPYNPNKNIVSGKLSSPQKTRSVYKVNLDKALMNHFSCSYLYAGLDKKFQIGAILGGIYSRRIIDKLISMHENGRIFIGAVPDRYAAIEVVCMARKICYFDDNICIYNSCKKNTWRSSVKKGYTELISQFSTPILDGSNHDYLVIKGVHASLANILATDYYYAQENVINKGYFQRTKRAYLDEVMLTVLVENELNKNSTLDEKEFKREKQELIEYIRGFNDEENERYLKYRRKLKIGKSILSPFDLMAKKIIMNIMSFLSNIRAELLLRIMEQFFQKILVDRYFTRDIRKLL